MISYGCETKGLPAAKISNITIGAGCGTFVGKSQGPVTFDTISADLENVFGDVDKEFIEGNTEELIKRDPEVFVLGYGYDGKETFEQAKRKFLAIPGVSDTKAARDGEIIGVPASESEPDPYAVAGLERIAKGLAGSG